MSRPSHSSQPLAVQPVYLAASAVNNLVRVLPAGTAYFIGIVLITMFTGQLVHHQGSLARAALPYVVHLRWGWHRVERALERGKVSLDALFDRALTWCVECLPVEQFRAATERDALVGRLRKNVALRRAPHPRRPGQRGRSPRHGPVLHPGAKRPEGRADEDTTLRVEGREVRVRRWRNLHFREAP